MTSHFYLLNHDKTDVSVLGPKLLRFRVEHIVTLDQCFSIILCHATPSKKKIICALLMLTPFDAEKHPRVFPRLSL